MDTKEKEVNAVEKPVPQKVVAKKKAFDATKEVAQLKAAVRFLAMQLGSAEQHATFHESFPELFK